MGEDYSIDLLANYGVPVDVVKNLKNNGYNFLTKLQYDSMELVFKNNKNLIISAPTNSGKTFIAELAVINNASLLQQGTCFFLFPLKALAEEKYISFKERYQELGIEFAISSGDYNEFDNDLDKFDVVILTYEKFLSLIIKNLVNLENIGLVVIDEIQLLGDRDRGINLEILITILLHKSENNLRVMGISATLNQESVKRIKDWLKASVISSNNREIELREGILYLGHRKINFKENTLKRGDYIYKEHNTGLVGLEKSSNFHDKNIISERAFDESFLIFFNTRNKTETILQNISVDGLKNAEIMKMIDNTERYIEKTPTFIRLSRIMRKGVGFHHSGMIPEERRLVTNAFNSGLIRVLASTSGLGAGVNTPAQNVILWDDKFHTGKPFSVAEYKNMAGRAGRIGYDSTYGRSILRARNIFQLNRLWKRYINAFPETVNSQLADLRNFSKYILSLLAPEICSTEETILEFTSNTYFGSIYVGETGSEVYEIVKDLLDEAMTFFKSEGLVYEENDKIFTTDLGFVIAKEGITINGGLLIYESLKEIQKNEIGQLTKDVRNFETSMIHLACSIEDALTNWFLFYYKPYKDKEILDTYWSRISKRILTSIGDQFHHYRAIKTTFGLLDYIKGESYSKLRSKYDVYHGTVRNSAIGISWIINVIKNIAKLDEFDFPKDFINYLDDLQDKLFFGVPKEALEILRLRLPIIRRNRAIELAKKGFSTLKSLIEASIGEITNVNGIDRDIAILIHKSIENHIQDNLKKTLIILKRRTHELGRDPSFIEHIYKKKDLDFEKACMDIFKSVFGFSCVYYGVESTHGCDFYFKEGNKTYAFECKRKKSDRLSQISSTEAEEILGKSAEFDKEIEKCVKITIGFPDFSKTAIEKCNNAGVTLITVGILGEMTVEYWNGKLQKEDILKILTSKNYIRSNDIKAFTNKIK